MKLFLMWSGDRSRIIAAALRDFLKIVVPGIEPFFSEDVDAGLVWDHVLAGAAHETNIGVACITKENSTSPWIHFEAGQVSKGSSSSKVIAYCIDLYPTDIAAPLNRFQNMKADREDTFRLTSSINKDREAPMPMEPLQILFEAAWRHLEGAIQRALALTTAIKPNLPTRSVEDMTREVLELVREMSRPGAVTRPPLGYAQANWLQLFKHAKHELSISDVSREYTEKYGSEPTAAETAALGGLTTRGFVLKTDEGDGERYFITPSGLNAIG